MRSFAPCVVVIVAGLALGLGSVVAMATDPGSRGGEARPVTTKAPPLPKQKRGVIIAHGSHNEPPAGTRIMPTRTRLAGT